MLTARDGDDVVAVLVKPAGDDTTDPTRAFYNHIWVIGDQEAIDVNQQAEVNDLAELERIGAGE